MQEFFILKGSTNPVLEMEVIKDGRNDYNKSLINYALQDSTVTFTMIDEENGIPKVSKAKANIVLANNESCDEQYILQYKWKEKDVNKTGFYKGFFDITFNGNIKGDNMQFPTGNLRVPIENDLRIIVK
jgi:hypothetical protein